MHESDYHQKPWLKFFVSGLRIVGAALLALFTALLTNDILTARLRDVLLVTRVPDSGHVVVCGMGKVGFEVTKLLQARQIPLVVIERDPQCPYLENLRRDGVPIIAGDAGNEVSLGQARSAGARAVIAVTSNDLVNLQIALVAKGISGREQTVVLLQSDPTLADLLRDEANLKNALSIPDLVAPAIAAAAFGERVHALFRLGKSTYAMVSVTLDKNTRLTRKSINQMARDMGGMVPLFVHDSSGTRHLVQAPRLPEHLERLTGLIPISNMRDRVISRQSITMARPPAG
jgi:voltage-gated potassium channel Kch